MSETEAIDWESDDSEEEEEEYTSPSQPPSSANFDKDRHLVYLQMMYELLPYHYQSQEINRLTLAHFIISGLHFLGATDRLPCRKEVAGDTSPDDVSKSLYRNGYLRERSSSGDFLLVCINKLASPRTVRSQLEEENKKAVAT